MERINPGMATRTASRAKYGLALVVLAMFALASTAAATPTMNVSPNEGPIGTPYVVTGGGFAPGQPVDLVWQTVEGNRVSGSGFGEVLWPLDVATADAAGAFRFASKAPFDLGGPAHRIEARVDGQRVAQTSFTITRTAEIWPTSGPLGTAITLHMTGGGWTQYDNIVAVTYDNAFIGFMCSFNSQGNMTLWLPATGDVGLHTIDVWPALYWGPSEGPTPWKIAHLSDGDQPTAIPKFHFEFQLTPGVAAARDMLALEGAITNAQPPLSAQALLANLRLSSTPTLALNSGLLPPGRDLVIAGGGFKAGEIVQLTWSTVTAKSVNAADKNKGWEVEPLTQVLSTATADAAGLFALRTMVPYDFGGDHDVQAIVKGETVAQTSLRIQPHFEFIGPGQVKAGEKVAIRGHGLGYEKYTAVWTVLYDNQLSGWVSAFETQGNVTFETYAVGAPGKHFIDIHEGSNGWPYLNLWESPWPWEPAAHFNFDIEGAEDVHAAAAPDGATTVPAQGMPFLLAVVAIAALGLRRFGRDSS